MTILAPMSQVLAVDGAVYRHLHRFSRGVIASLLWVIPAATVVLSGPATAALCSVVRQWNRGDDPSVVSAFATGFRANLRQGLQLQVLLLFAASIVVGAALAVPSVGPAAQVALVCVAGPLGVAALIVATWGFPLMVNFSVTTRRLLSTALLLGLSRPGTTLLNVGVIALACALSIVAPILPLLISGLVAGTVCLRCSRVFEQVGTAAT